MARTESMSEYVMIDQLLTATFNELDNLSSKQQVEIVTYASERIGVGWKDYRASVLVSAMIIIVFNVIWWAEAYFDVRLQWATGVAFLLGVLLWIIDRRRRLRRGIQTELIERNIRPLKCLNCRYDLRGCPADRTTCPECGAAIAPLSNTNCEEGM